MLDDDSDDSSGEFDDEAASSVMLNGPGFLAHNLNDISEVMVERDTSDEFSADTTECSSVSSASTKSSRSPSPRSLLLLQNHARKMRMEYEDTDDAEGTDSDFSAVSRADSFF